jgi:hypothetical protein
MMSDAQQLSEGKRVLVEKYLRGDLTQGAMAAGVGTQHADAEVDGSRERAVVVQAGEGSKRPFFFLHGDWNGSAFFCFPLARELGSEQPFYALEPYRFDGLPVPPTIETMATAHIKSMRAVQPEGPYLLGGWCNGGLVAYEMARQLHASGQSVDLLVLMDAFYLGYCTPRRLLRVVINHLGDLIGLDLDKQLNWYLRLRNVWNPLLNVYSRLRNVRHESSHDSVRLIINDVISFARQKVMKSIKRFASMFEHHRASPPRLDSLDQTTEALDQDWPGMFEWADMYYKPPGLYPGKITFFWPGDEPRHTVLGGWHKVAEAKEAQDVEVYVIPGNQSTWRTEHLHALAERLRTCL